MRRASPPDLTPCFGSTPSTPILGAGRNGSTRAQSWNGARGAARCRWVSLELHRAFAILLDGEPSDAARAAHAAVLEAAHRFARADRRCRADERDDCAQEVTFKLWKRLAMGDCPVSQPTAQACAAYMKSMVTNWVTDRLRRAKRARQGLARFVDQASLTSCVGDAESAALEREHQEDAAERRALVWSILAQLAARAIERRAPRHRPHLVQGWREIEAIVRDGAPLDAVLELARDATRAERTRARNAAYKRHERTRSALEEALEELARAELGAEQVELARLAIAQLARCQRADPSIEPVEESP